MFNTPRFQPSILGSVTFGTQIHVGIMCIFWCQKCDRHQTGRTLRKAFGDVATSTQKTTWPSKITIFFRLFCMGHILLRAFSNQAAIHSALKVFQAGNCRPKPGGCDGNDKTVLSLDWSLLTCRWCFHLVCPLNNLKQIPPNPKHIESSAQKPNIVFQRFFTRPSVHHCLRCSNASWRNWALVVSAMGNLSITNWCKSPLDSEVEAIPCQVFRNN